MHGKWMLRKLQERTGTLKCIYVPPSRHSSSPPPLPRLLLAPPALSNFFSSVIHSSRVLFLLFCFIFSCLRLRRRSEGHTPLYYATEKISCAKKISTTTMHKKTKSFEDWEQLGKRTQKVVQICARYLMQGTDVVRTTRTMIASLVILSTRKIMENRKWR